jgi:hypothetical protein
VGIEVKGILEPQAVLVLEFLVSFLGTRWWNPTLRKYAKHVAPGRAESLSLSFCISLRFFPRCSEYCPCVSFLCDPKHAMLQLIDAMSKLFYENQ